MTEDIKLPEDSNQVGHKVPKEIQKARKSLIVSQLSQSNSKINSGEEHKD